MSTNLLSDLSYIIPICIHHLNTIIYLLYVNILTLWYTMVNRCIYEQTSIIIILTNEFISILAKINSIIFGFDILDTRRGEECTYVCIFD